MRTNFNELRESLLALFETGQDQLASRTVQHVMDDIHNQSVWFELRDVLQQTIDPKQLQTEPWIHQYSQVLRGCRDISKLLEVSEHSYNPLVRLERVWAFVINQDFVAAQEILNEILPSLTGIPLGFAYRCLTSIEFKLGRDWRSTWQHVRSRLTGRALGIALLDETFQYAEAGEEERSRTSAIEAAPLLERDPYYFAWAQHSLGMSYLRDNLLEQAEQALVESEQLSRQRRAKAFRARALCGVGSLRRAQGHLGMAETQYRQAIKLAQESDDLLAALWGVGHCLRLQGKPEEALGQFERALRVSVLSNWIEVHRALAFLMLDQSENARTAIKNAGQVPGATIHRMCVARGELARLDGDTKLAKQEIQTVASNSLAAREESRLFPALFELLESDSTNLISAIPVSEKHVVEITHDQLISIRVNGRPVSVGTESKSALLLPTLLELDGRASVEVLVKRLWPDSLEMDFQRKRKQLWRTAQHLSNLLGWRDALQTGVNGYQLDSKTDWRIKL